MNITPRMKTIRESIDVDFITMVQYMRRENVLPIEHDMIVERLNTMNLEFVYGCCGVNIVRRKKRENTKE